MLNLKNSKGFTLLEVLIVVAIIVIIAGIAMPRFLGISEQGRKAKAMGDLRVLQTAVESYILNTNKLPASGTTLETANPQIISDFTKDFADPFAANGTSNYKYVSQANAETGKKYYAFASGGPNQTVGGLSINEENGTIAVADPDDIIVTNAQKVTGED